MARCSDHRKDIVGDVGLRCVRESFAAKHSLAAAGGLLSAASRLAATVVESGVCTDEIAGSAVDPVTVRNPEQWARHGVQQGGGATGRLRVLAVEPYYAGSHRQFLDQWRDHSRHTFDLVTFPGRHWKWRMRHSALSAAREIDTRAAAGGEWDVLFASSMLALAELRGLSAFAARLPAVLYFHENQLTYPVRTYPEGTGAKGGSGETGARDAHFGYSNFLSCCAAQRIWFNSGFHRTEWLAALPRFLNRFPDYSECSWLERVEAKSEVQWPGVSEPLTGAERGPFFEITWAARWEHDKNPEDFFRALSLLMRAKPEARWRVNVLGESFREVPECFKEGRRTLGERVHTWGFVPRQQYLETLARTDVFVATAHHEFFGLSAVEAMAAGARPLFPDRLAYPELVEGQRRFLYDGTPEGLAKGLQILLSTEGNQDLEHRVRSRCASAEGFLWRCRAPVLDGALNEVVSRASVP